MKFLIFVLFQAPSSLLDALEQHLASLEGKKIKDSTAASRYIFIYLYFLTVEDGSYFFRRSR
jgi:hypothetical protein